MYRVCMCVQIYISIDAHEYKQPFFSYNCNRRKF